MTIQHLMTKLEELYARRDVVTSDKQFALEHMLSPDQRAILLKFDAEYEEINDAIKAAEEQVKVAVLKAGETVKGTRYQAVYGKGRVSWDNKGLEQYFKAHDLDALKRYRKEGAPSVSIRTVKE
jgi:hypothetical protein